MQDQSLLTLHSKGHSSLSRLWVQDHVCLIWTFKFSSVSTGFYSFCTLFLIIILYLVPCIYVPMN